MDNLSTLKKEKLLAKQNIELENRANHQFSWEVHQEHSVELVFPPCTKGTLLILIDGEGKLNLKLNIMEKANWSYLIINRSDLALEFNETINIAEDAIVNASYGELSKGIHKRKTIFSLIGTKSRLEVHTAGTIFNQLEWELSAVHEAKHSYSNLQNKMVAFENSKLTIDVLGHIKKSFSKSSAHQETRVLNMSDPKLIKVFPKLIIDENDVEASHAASIGQVDLDTIYYLCSRGLDKELATKLLTLAYLRPIIDNLTDEEMKENLLSYLKESIKLEI